jgi:hypothetical protein
MPKETEHYSKKEAARRAEAAIRNMFATPHKPQRELFGQPGARGEAQRRRRAKERRAS